GMFGKKKRFAAIHVLACVGNAVAQEKDALRPMEKIVGGSERNPDEEKRGGEEGKWRTQHGMVERSRKWTAGRGLFHFWVRRGAALGEAERPLDTAEQVRLVLPADFRRVGAAGEIWIVAPEVFAMP